jgi:CubicO group peptidase (beta-lactamase class C family)
LASGQLISSVEDIGHYLIAQLNEGEYAGVQILSPEGIAQMHQPAADISVAGMGMGNYGMGWFSKEFSQGQLVFHYGEVPDYFAYMACLPEQNRAMVLLVNTNEQMFNYALWATSEAAALMLAGIPPRPNAWGILPWVVRGFLFLPVLHVKKNKTLGDESNQPPQFRSDVATSHPVTDHPQSDFDSDRSGYIGERYVQIYHALYG